MKENKLLVYMEDRLAGTLSETADRRIAFSYDDSWLRDGFAISPFSLPVEQRVFVPAREPFGGLWGVFSDSLPDAWGRLLLDRLLQSRGIDPAGVSALERLAAVGNSGMGALSYRPARDAKEAPSPGDLDELASQCHALLERGDVKDPDALFRMGGSSGGARPKVMTGEWIIKFPASRDMKDSGVMEKEYTDCAAACGIAVPETRLLPSKLCGGYFSARRFDRETVNGTLTRRHVLTASAILETDWRSPSPDYRTLMKLTSILSRGSTEDILQMYRRMCFNVFARNLDDHAKNFSWIYDPRLDCWHPSPAYDLTRGNTYFGEHTTSVDGNGRDPGMNELIAVGRSAGIAPAKCRSIAEEIRELAIPLEEKWRFTAS